MSSMSMGSTLAMPADLHDYLSKEMIKTFVRSIAEVEAVWAQVMPLRGVRSRQSSRISSGVSLVL